MTTRLSRLLIAVVFIILSGVIVLWMAANPRNVTAQATDQKRYVHCESVRMGTYPNYYYVLTCTTEDSIPFDENGTTVPATQRFYITDIIPDQYNYTWIDQYHNDTVVASLGLRTQSAHFTSPYFVLLHGDYLRSSAPMNASGYIITNQTFLPNISK